MFVSENMISVDNLISIKKFGTDLYKIVLHKKSVRLSGYELENSDDENILDCKSDGKLNCNLVRARSTVFELAYCNQWDWFFTGTLSGANGDRSNLSEFRKRFTQFVRDERKRLNLDIKYLIVPELHSDMQNWHFHGLISGLPVEHLERFQTGMKMGKHIADKVNKGDIVYNWTRYAAKFGWCDLEPIKDNEAVSKYLTKYITKTIFNHEDGRGVKELDKHLYYVSQGLNRSQEIKKGVSTTAIVDTLDWDYENEYVFSLSTKDINLVKTLLDSIVDVKPNVNIKNMTNFISNRHEI